MGIPEDQLEAWSHLGSVTQSKQTNATIRLALEDPSSPYFLKSFDCFLQGSYANDTNIRGDSDVDTVIMLRDTFASDIKDAFNQNVQQHFDATYSRPTYYYADFRRDVTARLMRQYPGKVTSGKKAIYIKGENNRRDADVIPCVEYRRYNRFNGIFDQDYVKGICLWMPDGTQIVNYPKQHSDNCTRKHQETNSMFKPTVRIHKNIRNRMVAAGLIRDGLAPSYFIEGLLYNVPRDHFFPNYRDTIQACHSWLMFQDRSKFVCSNEQYYLLNPISPVTWRKEDCDAYLDAFATFWNTWR